MHNSFRVMKASTNNEWETPPELFNRLDRTYLLTLDPCCTKATAKCAEYFTIKEDGLSKSWYGHRVFMNPPFGREIGAWIKKAYEESQRGALVVCLIPARTSTAYWHDYCMKGQIQFIRGRVNYLKNGKPGKDPFPSAIVVFTPPLTPRM